METHANLVVEISSENFQNTELVMSNLECGSSLMCCVRALIKKQLRISPLILNFVISFRFLS